MNFQNLLTKIAVISFFVIQSQAVHSYVGSVSAATGEAGRASVEAGDSFYLNPASIAYLNGYYFATAYGKSNKSLAGNSSDFSVSITDNMKETILPTTLAYVQTTEDVGGGIEDIQKNIRLAFGNTVSRGFSFGMGIVHRDDRFNNAQHYSQTNLQLGGLWALTPDFGLGLVADNSIPGSPSIPEAYRLQQSTGLGVNYNIRKLIRLRADVVSENNNSWRAPTVMGGVENYLNRWMILRIGAQKNNAADYSLYSAGLGFVGPQFALNYAYQSSPQDQSRTRHSIDLAVPVW